MSSLRCRTYAPMTITVRSSYCVIRRRHVCVAASTIAAATVRAQVERGSARRMPSTPKSSPSGDGDSMTPSL